MNRIKKLTVWQT